ncbi:hypothetical protein LJ707_08790 [Mucilaginibacter sp. UR6-1]|uniref:hypothetical protein n=1 Tax=Mucilaginibacter sp. UR6-1 TaxID=1435643 RepID=UPI001E2C2773|nr:hypothetical protein [Mucilaginibacter sp. UR6-1]MCC8409025.1 hypothetical protein [Mucilaginibacter sp. UR6-1]
MTTINEMAWDDRNDQLKQNETGYAGQNYTASDNAVDPDEDDLDEEDELLYEEELDTELEDDELDTSIEDDEVAATDPLYDEEDESTTSGYTNTLSNDAAFDREYDENEGNGLDEDKDFEAHLAPESVDPDPNEIPEEGESDNEGSGYTPSREYSEPQEGNDASYSEQTDVTPPNHKEFPSEGPAKADFEARPHGRTTGRMIGHEPGTEGI